MLTALRLSDSLHLDCSCSVLRTDLDSNTSHRLAFNIFIVDSANEHASRINIISPWHPSLGHCILAHIAST